MVSSLRKSFDCLLVFLQEVGQQVDMASYQADLNAVVAFEALYPAIRGVVFNEVSDDVGMAPATGLVHGCFLGVVHLIDICTKSDQHSNRRQTRLPDCYCERRVAIIVFDMHVRAMFQHHLSSLRTIDRVS